MGSCLSSLISSLFITILEIDVIKKFEKSGDIISWLRYADDKCCIIKKVSFNVRWKNFITYEKSQQNSLKSLDWKLF